MTWKLLVAAEDVAKKRGAIAPIVLRTGPSLPTQDARVIPKRMPTRGTWVEMTHEFARRDQAALTRVTVQARADEVVRLRRQSDGELLAESAASSFRDAKTTEHVIDVDGLAPQTAIEVTTVVGDDVTLLETLHTPAVPFAVAALVASSTGAPFDRFGFGGRLDFTGPFLRFSAPNVTCPFGQVRIHNATSDERYWVEADANGAVTIELSDTFPGDVLHFVAEDHAGHPSPLTLHDYVVPSAPTPTRAMTAALESDSAAAIEAALREESNAANRAVVEEFAATATEDIAKRLRAAIASVFSDANQVLLHSTPRPTPS